MSLLNALQSRLSCEEDFATHNHTCPKIKSCWFSFSKFTGRLLTFIQFSMCRFEMAPKLLRLKAQVSLLIEHKGIRIYFSISLEIVVLILYASYQLLFTLTSCSLSARPHEDTWCSCGLSFPASSMLFVFGFCYIWLSMFSYVFSNQNQSIWHISLTT